MIERDRQCEAGGGDDQDSRGRTLGPCGLARLRDGAGLASIAGLVLHAAMLLAAAQRQLDDHGYPDLSVRSGALARTGEQRRLAFHPHPLLHLARMVRALAVAAAVAENEMVERMGLGRRRDLLDLGPLVVPGGKVEPHRSAAAAATVAVAAAQRTEALLVLLAAVLPGDHETDNAAHGSALKRNCLPSG